MLIVSFCISGFFWSWKQSYDKIKIKADHAVKYKTDNE